MIDVTKQSEPNVFDSATSKNYLIRYLPPLSMLVAATLWNWQVTGHHSIMAVIVYFGLILVSVAAGDLFLKFTMGSSNRFDNFSTRILCGFFIASIVLMILAFISPYGLALDSLLLSIVVCIAWALSKRTKLKSLWDGASIPEAVFIIIALVAVTFWCQDLASPIVADQVYTIVNAYWDIFFHSQQINQFAASHGYGSMSDFQMAGAPVFPYHYGSYIVPAAIVAITSTSSFEVFLSFYVFFGLLLTALASYSLASSLFGKWPGVAAGLTILLAPDAFQQGFGNQLLSYHYFMQIGPALPYGVALAALAFLFMFEGCRTGKFHLVAVSYALAACTLIFKINIFVAIAYVILVFPAMFMAGLKTKHRWVYFLVGTGLFVGVILLSNNFSSVPTLQLDGSGLRPYEELLLKYQSPGFLKLFFESIIQGKNVWTFSAIAFALIIIVCTFGAPFIIYLGLIFRLKSSFNPVVVYFPILITINYLVMSELLAPLNTYFGTFDEFMHRPFVWAYFVMYTWVGSGLYYVLIGNSLPKKGTAYMLTALIICLGIYTPIHYGKGIQQRRVNLPDGGWTTTRNRVPTCIFKISQLIRDNSSPNEIVQDSLNDPGIRLSALSERQEFAIDMGGKRSPVGIKERFQQLQAFKNMVSDADINSFAKQNAIKWYVLEPRDKVMWPDNNEHRILYKCGDFIAFHFI
jgi:hypothetical protein